jgi:diguanylate cyclase (GGDEF)-like protein/PAS domain S-box-containing protein
MSDKSPPHDTIRANTDLGDMVRRGKPPPSRINLNPVVTKTAVDLLNLTEETADEVVTNALKGIREVSGTDSVCMARFAPDPENPGIRAITKLSHSTSVLGGCSPEGLLGQDLAQLPWLDARLDHLRLLEITDTRRPVEENRAECELLAGLGIGAALIGGFSVDGDKVGFLAMLSASPVDAWDVDCYLLMKLIGASLASGFARLRLEQDLGDVRERDELYACAANDGIWDFDVETGFLKFSNRWKEMMGYEPDELEDQRLDWHHMVHPDDMVRVQGRIREHLEGKSPLFESIHRMRHKSGDWRWVISRAKARTDEEGRLKRLLGVELDITEQKLYEEALFREKESAQITLQSIGDGVVTTDSECRVEYLNPIAEDLTGWKLDDASGRPIDEIFRGFHEETCEPLENPLAVAIRRNRPIKSVRPTLLIRRDGNELYIESTAAPIRSDLGRNSGGVLVFHDVSESRELNRRLSYHASHDMLTGLVNRREFEGRLERGLKNARSREAQYALCYMDLDQFKIVNDSCGHSAGDALLGQLGALLKSKIRWRDTLARLGGDEFGILLENCTVDEAIESAENLLTAVQDFRFVWEDRSFRLGASIGVVPITPETASVAELLTAADSACAAAKEAGRNRVHTYQVNDIDLMRRRREMQWAARISNALEESRFELFRMTIMPLQEEVTGAHYELLLRMKDENGQMISPDVFITAAERYGITPRIDRWVIENAFRWLVSEADERKRLAMCSINLSGLSLGDDKFLPFVIDQFESSGLDASKICFEITETAAIASFSQANRFIQSLKELGCKFALDDFGTGLSSFGYLKHFPVDYLKIDGSFVKEILHDPIDREMVRSINEIGHLTGKKTIAEFAETEEIITMLRGIGVDFAQGYAIDEPHRIFEAGFDANQFRG